MRNFLIIFSFFYLTSCSLSKELSKNEMSYKVSKIESLNNWNIIYLSRDTIRYKLVSLNVKNKDCHRIKEGKTYNFKLQSRKENVPVINGIELKVANYLDVEGYVYDKNGVTCYLYDQETEICTDPKNNIHDLFYSRNLKGLCIE